MTPLGTSTAGQGNTPLGGGGEHAYHVRAKRPAQPGAEERIHGQLCAAEDAFVERLYGPPPPRRVHSGIAAQMRDGAVESNAHRPSGGCEVWRRRRSRRRQLLPGPQRTVTGRADQRAITSPGPPRSRRCVR